MNKQNLETAYSNITKITDFLLDFYKIKFETSLIAPNNYKDMVKHYELNDYFLVYSGGDHGYLGYEYNTKFRALHDFMHYFHKLTFKFEDEKKLSDITADQFFKVGKLMGLRLGECIDIADVITAEIKGQIEYYQVNKKYVDDQKKYIENYFNI